MQGKTQGYKNVRLINEYPVKGPENNSISRSIVKVSIGYKNSFYSLKQ